MQNKHFLSSLFIICIFSLSLSAQEMNNESLGKILEAEGDSLIGRPGSWQFNVHDHYLLVFTDESHNRMRIISPIVEVKDLEPAYLENALMANFHTALDVKYAISDGIMWSVFIHPLKELTEAQVEDAIIQVYRAAATFGTTYSSTDLFFPGNAGQEKDEKEKAPEEKEQKDKNKTSKT